MGRGAGWVAIRLATHTPKRAYHKRITHQTMLDEVKLLKETIKKNDGNLKYQALIDHYFRED